MLREAEEDASRQRGDAEVEAARRRRETDEQCEAELEAAKARVGHGRRGPPYAGAHLRRSDPPSGRPTSRSRRERRPSTHPRVVPRRQLDLAAILAELEDSCPTTRTRSGCLTCRVPDARQAAAVGSTGAGARLGEIDLAATVAEPRTEPGPAEPVARPAEPDEPGGRSQPDEVFDSMGKPGSQRSSRSRRSRRSRRSSQSSWSRKRDPRSAALSNGTAEHPQREARPPSTTCSRPRDLGCDHRRTRSRDLGSRHDRR